MTKAVIKEEMPLLDTKHLEILKLLQQNARITIKEISEKVHLSTVDGGSGGDQAIHHDR